MLEIDRKIAYIFPGQGSQEVGVVGQEAVQLAVVGKSCSLLDLSKVAKRPGFFAGFSVGMWSAMRAAGMIEDKDLFPAIKKRAGLMGAVEPGKMAAIIGRNWNEDKAMDVWSREGVSLAVISCPGQFVISGREADVVKASNLAKQSEMKAIDIKVAGANHSALMIPIQPEFREYVIGLNLNPPKGFIMFNTSGLPNGSVLAVKDELVDHLPRTVQWEVTVRNMISMGVNIFVEWGSDTLSKMIKRIDSEVRTISIMDIKQAEGLIL